jgi:hypothetical protein
MSTSPRASRRSGAGRGALGTAYGVRPALWVARVGATTTVLWTWFSPLRDADVVAD